MWHGSTTDSQLCSTLNPGLFPGDKLLLLVLSRQKYPYLLLKEKAGAWCPANPVSGVSLLMTAQEGAWMMCLVDKFGHNWQNSCCLVSFLVSCVSLSRAGSTGNIFMLFLFIPFTIQRVWQGREGSGILGQWETSVTVKQRLPRPGSEKMGAATLWLLCPFLDLVLLVLV